MIPNNKTQATMLVWSGNTTQPRSSKGCRRSKQHPSQKTYHPITSKSDINLQTAPRGTALQHLLSTTTPTEQPPRHRHNTPVTAKHDHITKVSAQQNTTMSNPTHLYHYHTYQTNIWANGWKNGSSEWWAKSKRLLMNDCIRITSGLNLRTI